MMTPEDKDMLINLIRTDDATAKQVYQILNALGTAQVCGQAVIMPVTKDHPIVLISYSESLKDMIVSQLETHGKKAPWDIDE